MYVTVSCNLQKTPVALNWQPQNSVFFFSSKGKNHNQVTCTYRHLEKNPRETGNKGGAAQFKMENLYQAEAAQSRSVNSDDQETI